MVVRLRAGRSVTPDIWLQVLSPLGDPAAGLGGLDPVAPRGEVEVEHGALEGERPARIGLDHLALAGPLVITVAVVAIEGGPQFGA